METAPPTLDVPVAGSAGPIVADDRACIRCSYNLRGLSHGGVCPECGTPVADSLKGFLLQHAAPEYIRTVRTGFSMVLNGILLTIVVSVLMMVAGGYAAVSRATTPGGPAPTRGAPVEMIAMLVLLAVYVMVFMGYLKATEPDPGFVGLEKPDAARKVVRGAVMAQVALQAVSIVAMLGGSTGLDPTTQAVLSGAMGFISYVVWAVQFFAMMRYMRWLAGRVPDQFMLNRTKLYMWLLPVLSTVGVVILFLGPLIALVMYWNLLDRMRKHLKAIQSTGAPAVLPKMMA